MDEPSQINFEYKILTALPANGAPDVYIPSGSSGVGRDGVLVKFWPAESPPWVGMYAFGDSGPDSIRGAYPGPGRNRLTIVADGEAYVANPDDPMHFDCASSFPVVNFIFAPHIPLVMFHDYTNIEAFGETGLAWKTDRISWDGIEIGGVTENEVFGTSWDSPNERHVKFRIRLIDGYCEGGAAPSWA